MVTEWLLNPFAWTLDLANQRAVLLQFQVLTGSRSCLDMVYLSV